MNSLLKGNIINFSKLNNVSIFSIIPIISKFDN